MCLDLVNSLQELKFATEDAAIKDEQFNAEISTVQSGLDNLFQFLVMRLDKLGQGVCPHEIELIQYEQTEDILLLECILFWFAEM